jgi:hypothetical protein
MDVDHMLSILVENKIVNNVRPKAISDLKGSFNYIGSAYQVGCRSCCCFELMLRCVGWVNVLTPFPCRQVTRLLSVRTRINLGCLKTLPWPKSVKT